MSKKIPEVIYGNAINGYGLWYKRPVKMKYNPTLKSWWDAHGNFDVKKLGLTGKNGYMAFASISRKEVMHWTRGVIASLSILKLFSSKGEK